MKRRWWIIGTALLLIGPAYAKVRLASKLAYKMLYGSKSTKIKAINEFNKLPASEQQKLVPDFKVAMSDENTDVQKIARRILVAMGVQPPETSDAPVAVEASTPSVEASTPTPVSTDPWASLKRMKEEENGNYPDLQQELANEKKSQITLDATDLLKQNNQ